MLLGGGREAIFFFLKVEQLEGGTATFSSSTENLWLKTLARKP